MILISIVDGKEITEETWMKFQKILITSEEFLETFCCVKERRYWKEDARKKAPLINHKFLIDKEEEYEETVETQVELTRENS